MLLSALVLNVNVKLVIRNGDAVLVKALLNRLENIEMNSPIIAALHPHTGGDVKAALSMLRKSYEGLGIGKDKLMRLANVHNNSLCPLKIIVIGDGECKSNSSGILLGVVNDIGI